MYQAETVEEKEKKLMTLIDPAKNPRHIAIIMDGNGRWAREKGYHRVVGHRQGMEAIRRVVSACVDYRIEVLTVYAFSTENWNRPPREVKVLMNLPFRYLKSDINKLMDNNVKLMISGDIKGLPEKVQQALSDAILRTAGNAGLIFNIALNYGGRDDITRAVRLLVQDINSGYLTKDDVNEEAIAARLYTAGLPDPDLLIRTSGEQRISNFLLWQSAYSEFLFIPQNWPDFDRICLLEAIAEFQGRKRRFGAL